MAKGTIKWFSFRRGYGFIQMDGDLGEVFFHRSQLDDYFKRAYADERVEFTITKTERGFVADDVKHLIDKSKIRKEIEELAEKRAQELIVEKELARKSSSEPSASEEMEIDEEAIKDTVNAIENSEEEEIDEEETEAVEEEVTANS